MAGTDFPVNHPLARKHWASDLFKEALKRTTALQFSGSGTESVIQIRSDLSKDSGDRIRFGLRQQLSGAGVSGDGTLEGNEEALETFYQDVFIDQLRHAVRSAGKMSEQRVPYSVRAEARDGLADWWADRIDTWLFNQLAGNTGQADLRYVGMQAAIAPDADHVTIPSSTGSTAEVSMSSTSVARFSLTWIDTAVERAKLAKNTLRPVQDGNKRYLVAFLHPTQVTSLRTNTNTGQWLDIQKAAMQGGKGADNPIFTGALGVYNNVILHESNRVPVSPNNASVRRAILCGAQAACMAFGKGYGKSSYSWKEELFDYGNQLGVGAGTIAGVIKTRFNGSDFATMVMPSFETAA